jgi:hypothetical protein
MKTLIVSLIAVGALVAGFVQRAWAAEEEEPATITIGGQAYTVVPDKELRALGFDVPDVKPEENAAYDYLNAIEAYHPIQRGDPLDRVRDEVMRSGWSDEAGPLADYIERNEKALEWIRKAAAKDVCHFPVLLRQGETLEDTSPSGIMLPYLSSMRELARFLVTVGKAHEYEGDFGDALDVYLLILRLGNHAAQDPTLIAGLVGIACDAIGCRAIEQCLVRNEIDETVLAEAQKQLAALAGGRPSVVVSMHGERAWSTSIIEYLIKHPGDVGDLADTTDGQSTTWRVAMTAMLVTEEGRAQIRADVKAFWEAMDKAMVMPLPEFIETGAGDKPIDKAKARKVPPNIMAQLGPSLGRARETFARNDVSWTVLDVEFALALYAAADGQYPQSLDELKDLMLSDGVDPYSGKPLHYRLEADGSYTIWSVGENLIDDGGKIPAKHIPTSGRDDHVWNSAVIHGEE